MGSADGEGHGFQQYLVGSISERLPVIQPGDATLDVACGNDVIARRSDEAFTFPVDFSPQNALIYGRRTG